MQYGIGSWFQKKIMDPIKKNWKPIAAIGAGAALNKWGLPGTEGFGTPDGGMGSKWLPRLLGGARDLVSEQITGNPHIDGRQPTGLGSFLSNPNFLIPAASLISGAFAKPDEPGYTGQGTGLNLRDVGRIANITDPKTAMASGLRFSPDLETRKFTPEEMLQSYAATDPKDFSTPGAAQGGRIGYDDGGAADQLEKALAEDDIIGLEKPFNLPTEELMALLKGIRAKKRRAYEQRQLGMTGIGAAQGGRIGAQEGGLMDLGGMEKDYRNDGGFVPLGGEEKADDVPARLSRNEFVFTADAVRNAGGGDMDRGAEVMENVMKNLEGGGKISDESQGKGAGEMFEVSERLSEVV